MKFFNYKNPRHLALACFALGILFGAFNLQTPCFIFVITAVILWVYRIITKKPKPRKPATKKQTTRSKPK